MLISKHALFARIGPEQKSRITVLFLQRDGGPTPTGDGYHLHQTKQVLALGGVVGSQFSGTAVDDPLAYHLPACRTDFVICMIGERWGFFEAISELDFGVVKCTALVIAVAYVLVNLLVDLAYGFADPRIRLS